jgi:hypothetical protein
MTKTNRDVRALSSSCLLFVALAFAPSCANKSDDTNAVELNDASEALTQAEYDCEREKRTCLISADCDADARDVCESALRACREPVRDERSRVRELCRTQRDACEADATSEAELHACHVAEHECKLPVDPPEAVCHVDALRCIWDARTEWPDAGWPDAGSPPRDHADEHACREQERACKDLLRLDREDLPKAPKCGRPHCAPREPAPKGWSADHFQCERERRECLIEADCDSNAYTACEVAFDACEEPARAERERVPALCRDERHSCEAASTDDAGRHACHIAHHRCTLAVDPPEAICRIEAHECRWAARLDDVTAPPAGPHHESAAHRACHEAEHDCVEATRLHPEDLPRLPLCAPVPPECTP